MTRWKLVSVEPTEGMLDRAIISKEQWTWALAAAPPVSDELVEEMARFLCEKLALETYDDVSRRKYLADARAIVAFLEGKK